MGNIIRKNDTRVPDITKPLVRILDLNFGEEEQVKLCHGSIALIEPIEVREVRDSVHRALRKVLVLIRVNQENVWLESSNHSTPKTVAGVQ